MTFSPSSLHNTFGTMKVSYKGGSFQLISNLISIYHETMVCGIFTNSISSSSYDRQGKNGKNLYCLEEPLLFV